MTKESRKIIPDMNVQDVDRFSAHLADGANESVVIYDADARILHWNPASQLLYGWTRAEVTGKRLTEVFGVAAAGVNWTELQANGLWHGIVQRRNSNGLPVLANIRIEAFEGDDGRVASYIEYGDPADARVVDGRAPEAQKDWIAVWSVDVSAASKALSFAAEKSPGVVGEVGKQANPAPIAERLKIIDLNFAASQLFGGESSPSDIIGKSAYDYWPKKHRDALLEMTIRLLQAAGNDESILKAEVGHDTLAVWRRASAQSDIISVTVSGSWNDPRTFWDLQASEQRYRNLINNVALPLWQVDARIMSEVVAKLKAANVTDIGEYLKDHPDLTDFASEVVAVTEVNDSAIRLFNGSSREQLLQNVRYLFAGTPEAAKRVVMAHFGGERNYSEDLKILTFDGELRDVLFYVTFPRAPEQLDTTLIMMVDITDQRKMEEHVKKIEGDFAHAARLSALGELATSIAHEVRQPLSVIVTDADTGLRWLGRDEPNVPKVKMLVARIMENAHRANEVIRRIKDMAVKSDPIRVAIDINAVVAEAAMFVRAESQRHSIAIKTRLASDLPNISGDRVQLQQVVVNLLINSIQAISSQQRRVREIAIETRIASERTISFAVKDTGGGVATEDLDRIFDGFFSRKSDGMGMGLAICRSIIADHGGTISVENDATTGAVFIVDLPIPEDTEISA